MAGANIAPSMTAFIAGQAPVANVPMQWLEIFSGTWVAGDEITTVLTNNITGLQTSIGAGDVTAVQPVVVFTYNNKVYALGASTTHFSAVDSPIIWNDPNATGNGSVEMSNYDGSPMVLVGIAHYQGRLVFLSRESILIWQIDADPAKWQLLQTLEHIGTVAKNSVKTVGDLDVYFLSDIGMQSLRVRDNTLNAVPSSVGDPINSLLLTTMQGASPNTSNACGVVEPTANRYWMFLKDTIYVLSSFPASKVLAWSTYKPTYSAAGTQTAFVPYTFNICNGQVYARGTDGGIYQYGGSGNNVFDSTKLKWQTGFMDAKTPGTKKMGRAIDVVCNTLLTSPDTWNIYASMDEKSAGDPTSSLTYWKKVYTNSGHTFDIGSIAYSGVGTHFSLYGETSGNAGPAVFSEALFHYDIADEKG